MRKRLLKLGVLMIASTFFLWSCGEASKSTSSSSSTSTPATFSSSISGTVTVPTGTGTSAKVTLKLSQGLASVGSTETPLASATVCAHDLVTGERRTDIGCVQTDASGNYTLDTSSIPTDNLDIPFRIVASKVESGQETIVGAYVEPGLDEVDVDAVSTLIVGEVQETVLLAVGNVLEYVDGDIPANTIDSMITEMETLIDHLDGIKDEFDGLSIDLTIPYDSDLTETERYNKLLLENVTALDSVVENDTTFSTARAAIEETFEETAVSLEYEEDMKLIEIDADINVTIELPPLPFPPGTQFSRGIALSAETTAIPTGAILATGFELPTGDRKVSLNYGTKFRMGDAIPDDYAAHLPPGMFVDDGVELPDGAYLPPEAEFVDDYVFEADKAFHYRDDYTMPANIKFEEDFPMPSGADIFFEEDFRMPIDVVFPEDMVIPTTVIDFITVDGDPASINATHLAYCVEIHDEFKDNFASNVSINTELAEKFAADFVVDRGVLDHFDQSDIEIDQDLFNKFDDSDHFLIPADIINVFHSDTRIIDKYADQFDAYDNDLIEKFHTEAYIPNEAKDRFAEHFDIDSEVAARFHEEFVVDEDVFQKFDTANIEIDQTLFDKFEDSSDFIIPPEVFDYFHEDTRITDTHADQLEKYTHDYVDQWFHDEADIPGGVEDRIFGEIPPDMIDKFGDTFKFDDRHIEAFDGVSINTVIMDKLHDTVTFSAQEAHHYFDFNNLVIDDEHTDRFTHFDAQLAGALDTNAHIPPDVEIIGDFDATIVDKLHADFNIEADDLERFVVSINTAVMDRLDEDVTFSAQEAHFMFDFENLVIKDDHVDRFSHFDEHLAGALDTNAYIPPDAEIIGDFTSDVVNKLHDEFEFIGDHLDRFKGVSINTEILDKFHEDVTFSAEHAEHFFDFENMEIDGDHLERFEEFNGALAGVLADGVHIPKDAELVGEITEDMINKADEGYVFTEEHMENLHDDFSFSDNHLDKFEFDNVDFSDYDSFTDVDLGDHDYYYDPYSGDWITSSDYKAKEDIEYYWHEDLDSWVISTNMDLSDYDATYDSTWEVWIVSDNFTLGDDDDHDTSTNNNDDDEDDDSSEDRSGIQGTIPEGYYYDVTQNTTVEIPDGYYFSYNRQEFVDETLYFDLFSNQFATIPNGYYVDYFTGLIAEPDYFYDSENDYNLTAIPDGYFYDRYNGMLREEEE